jgi:hypothetical protein
LQSSKNKDSQKKNKIKNIIRKTNKLKKNKTINLKLRDSYDLLLFAITKNIIYYFLLKKKNYNYNRMFIFDPNTKDDRSFSLAKLYINLEE